MLKPTLQLFWLPCEGQTWRAVAYSAINTLYAVAHNKKSKTASEVVFLISSNTVLRFRAVAVTTSIKSPKLLESCWLSYAMLVLCLSAYLSSGTLNCDRRKLCWLSISSDIRHQRPFRALNNFSSAAELSSVELIFMNSISVAWHESRMSMDFSFDPK